MFPGRYPRNSYFKWAVVAPSGFRIKIEFTKLGIQGYGIECQPDAVIVRDRPSVQSELIIKICGTRQNKEVHSSGNSMTIEFVSEVRSSDEDYIGFKATVSKGRDFTQHVKCGIKQAIFVAITVHFTVMCFVTLPLSGSEAGGDLALIQTFLPFMC